MTLIDMTTQLAPIIWGFQATLAISAAAITVTAVANRLRSKSRRMKVGLRPSEVLSGTPC